jgi:hypothetical protein
MHPEIFSKHWEGAGVDRFELTIEEGFSGSEVLQNVTRDLDAQGIPVSVMSKDRLIERSYEPIGQIFSMARRIQLAALLIAALAIANTMFIHVLERRWELGLQRAIGMAGVSIRQTLLIEAGAIGAIRRIGGMDSRDRHRISDGPGHGGSICIHVPLRDPPRADGHHLGHPEASSRSPRVSIRARRHCARRSSRL